MFSNLLDKYYTIINFIIKIKTDNLNKNNTPIVFLSQITLFNII